MLSTVAFRFGIGISYFSVWFVTCHLLPASHANVTMSLQRLRLDLALCEQAQLIRVAACSGMCCEAPALVGDLVKRMLHGKKATTRLIKR